jgi:hypothetical protein
VGWTQGRVSSKQKWHAPSENRLKKDHNLSPPFCSTFTLEVKSCHGVNSSMEWLRWQETEGKSLANGPWAAAFCTWKRVLPHRAFRWDRAQGNTFTEALRR